MRLPRLIGALVVLAAACPASRGEPVALPTTTPATTQSTRPARAATLPTQPASVSFEGARLIRLAHEALGKAAPFRAIGTLHGDFDVAGRSKQYDVKLQSAFATDGRFRHELVGVGVIAGDAKAVTLYDARRNSFATVDWTAKIGTAGDVYAPLVHILLDENPALLIALSNEPQELIARGATSVRRVDDEGKLAVLRIESNDAVRTIYFDPQTSLPQRLTIDLRPRFADAGAAVAKAWVRLDYESIAADAAIPASTYAFSPPATATEFQLGPATAPATRPGAELIRPDTQPAGHDGFGR